MSCNGCCTDERTVTGEFALNSCSSLDFSDLSGEDSAGKRPTILEREKRATRVSPHCQVCQKSLKGAKKEAYPANEDEAAFLKGDSLGGFNPHRQSGRICVKVY